MYEATTKYSIAYKQATHTSKGVFNSKDLIKLFKV